jgi:hypothetical protein
MELMKPKNSFQLDERKLSEQRLFRMAILIPLSISIFLCIPLWMETSIDISSNGYNNFLSLYKLPIGVLSLSIPLVAIVAHIHRTIQTAKQIELTNQKNITDRFFSHHKYVTDALTSIKSEKVHIKNESISLKITNPFILYRDVFPNASHINGIDTNIKSEIFNTIIARLNDINNLLTQSEEVSLHQNFKSHPSGELVLNLHDILFNINALVSIMCISKEFDYLTEKYKYLLHYNNTRIKLVITINNEDELKDFINSVYNIAFKVFDIFQVENIPHFISISHYVHKGKKYFFSDVFSRFIQTTEQTINFTYGEHAFDNDEYEMYEINICEQSSGNVS